MSGSHASDWPPTCVCLASLGGLVASVSRALFDYGLNLPSLPAVEAAMLFPENLPSWPILLGLCPFTLSQLPIFLPWHLCGPYLWDGLRV